MRSTIRPIAMLALIGGLAVAVVAENSFAGVVNTYNVTSLDNSTGFGFDPDKPAPTITADGFHASGNVGDYNSIRVKPDAIGMHGLTIGDILSISYDHAQANGGIDWQAKVYTVGTDGKWYNYRLNYDLSTANTDGSFSTFTATNADGERIAYKPTASTPTYRLNDPTGYANLLASIADEPVLYFDISAGASTGGYAYDTTLQNFTVKSNLGTSVVSATVPEPASIAAVGLGSIGLLRRRRRLT